ncbi:hypothetical protein DSUL_150089 [Desulfovibrionales bacterium]
MALDEPTVKDDVVNVDGYSFIVEKVLMEKGKPFTLDITYMGFTIESQLTLRGGGCNTGCINADSCS